MGSAKFNVGRVLLVRAEHDFDLLEFLTNLAKTEKIITATFTAIGALKNAKLGFYDQQKHNYGEITLSAPQEIASCIGNISRKHGEPFVHAHAVLSGKEGTTKAGHLLEGRVFATEVHLIELIGEGVDRESDEVTGLALWRFGHVEAS